MRAHHAKVAAMAWFLAGSQACSSSSADIGGGDAGERDAGADATTTLPADGGFEAGDAGATDASADSGAPDADAGTDGGIASRRMVPSSIRGVKTDYENSYDRDGQQPYDKGSGFVRFTIQPDLFGLDLVSWYQNLDQGGITDALLNLVPSVNGSTDGASLYTAGACAGPPDCFTEAQWTGQYIPALYVPDSAKTPAEIAIIGEPFEVNAQSAYVVVPPGTVPSDIGGAAPTYPASWPYASCATGLSNAACTSALGSGRDYVSYNRYSTQQRNEVQLDLLGRLQAAQARSQISGNLRFVLNERYWFPSTPSACDSWATCSTLEDDFATDVSGVINAAIAQGLDGWIDGIRLEEHSNVDPSQLLYLVVDLATKIDGATNGWLSRHTMVVNGGGCGSFYAGIDAVTCPTGTGYTFDGACQAGQPFPFYSLLSKHAGAFAFGYKIMEGACTSSLTIGSVTHDTGIVGNMTATMCPATTCGAAGHTCVSSCTDDWKWYLGDPTSLGFADLVSLVSANEAAYPDHAQVMFIGDDGDGLVSLTGGSTVGGTKNAQNVTCDEPEMVALRDLWPAGAGWKGRQFLNGYQSLDYAVTRGRYDIGLAWSYVRAWPLTFTTGTGVAANTASQSLWASWPSPPTGWNPCP